MEAISRNQTREMITSNGVTVVEVLSPEKYREYHLPGAINVPLGNDFDQRIQDAIPDKSAPVIVYCYDADCDASPKAARRMAKLGYQTVYDYEAGKVDWKEAGLPIEK
jgi:rhodanese-related sulfurtransferase